MAARKRQIQRGTSISHTILKTAAHKRPHVGLFFPFKLPFTASRLNCLEQFIREIRNGFCYKESVVFRDFGGNDDRLRPFTVEV